MKQGCAASPHVVFPFFNRVRDFIAAYVPPSCQVYTPYLALLVTFILLYMYDVALIAVSLQRLLQLFHNFGHFADVHRMCISQDKMQVLLC